MIPIKAGATLDVKDGATTYKLKYITVADEFEQYGKIEQEHARIRDEIMQRARAACPGADDAVVEATYSKLREEDSRTQGHKYIRVNDMYIDTFLCGWDGDGLPPFPADGRPSRCFRAYDKNAMVGLIIEALPELLGFALDEVKN